MSNAGAPEGIIGILRAGFLRVALSILLAFFQLASLTSTASAKDLCGGVLPEDIRQAIAQHFSGWAIQSPSTLSSSAKDRWNSEKPIACPGLARGLFANSSRASYAVLIVRADNHDVGAKLLLFVSNSADDMQVLEDATTGGKDLFIHAATVSKFFDKNSVAKFKVQTPEALLLFDAGKNEYETDIYFRTENGYRHEPVDH